MPVSRALGCLFVHVPKTGGTSIEAALGVHGDWRVEDREMLFGQIQSPDLRGRSYLTRYLQHLTLDEVRRLSPDCARLFTFSIVRNPWDRIVSTYSKPDPDMVQHARAAGVELTGLEFPQFVRRVFTVEHVHLVPQHRFVADGKGRVAVDFLGRFERLEDDFRAVCRRLGIERDLPHRNPSEHGPYRELHTEETRRLIAERYRRDVELFGYRF